MILMCVVIKADKDISKCYGINKKTLREMSGISATSVAKLGKGGNVNTDVLLRICDALHCDVGDIMEFVPGQESEKETET